MINEVVIFIIFLFLIGITYLLTYKKREAFDNNYHSKPFIPNDESESGDKELQKIKKINEALLNKNAIENANRAKMAQQHYENALKQEKDGEMQAKKNYKINLDTWNKQTTQYNKCLADEAKRIAEETAKKLQYKQDLANWNSKTQTFIQCQKDEMIAAEAARVAAEAARQKELQIQIELARQQELKRQKELERQQKLLENPCFEYTDDTLAKDVSPACLQKTWKDLGCNENGVVYPKDNYKGWWNQSPQGLNRVYCDNNGTPCGAGSFKNTKEDMTLWATLNDEQHRKGCGRLLLEDTTNNLPVPGTWRNTKELPQKFKPNQTSKSVAEIKGDPNSDNVCPAGQYNISGKCVIVNNGDPNKQPGLNQCQFGFYRDNVSKINPDKPGPSWRTFTCRTDDGPIVEPGYKGGWCPTFHDHIDNPNEIDDCKFNAAYGNNVFNNFGGRSNVSSLIDMTGRHELCPNPYGLRRGCGPGCVNISQAENGNWRCTNPGGPWKTPDKCPPGYKLNSQFACVI